MHLQIYSLKKTVYDGGAVAVTGRTKNGEIAVLKNHEPLITILEPGLLIVTPSGSGEKKYFNSQGGILEVRPKSRVRIILEE